MRPSSVKPATNAATLALAEALGRSEPLGNLLQRLQASRERFDAIAALLPEPLRAEVRPGPLDEAGWSLLVSGGAAASKLRQLAPRIDADLAQRGFVPLPLRIRVQAR
jgi:hypothetical protein